MQMHTSDISFSENLASGLVPVVALNRSATVQSSASAKKRSKIGYTPIALGVNRFW
jgi:hypothetical protein